MNFKRQAEKLETFLTEEFSKNLPIAQFPNGTIVYNSFKIKKNKRNNWVLYKAGVVNPIESFNLKACALITAKLYEKNNITKINEIKALDQTYQHNQTDSAIFKYRFETSKDPDRRDLALWRWELTAQRATETKSKIANMFRLHFDK